MFGFYLWEKSKKFSYRNVKSLLSVVDTDRISKNINCRYDMISYFMACISNVCMLTCKYSDEPRLQ